MNSRELMRAAMRREPTERIPSMPQICHDTPVRIYAAQEGADWREGYRRCVEQPAQRLELLRTLAADPDAGGVGDVSLIENADQDIRTDVDGSG